MQRDAREGNLILNIIFLAMKTKTRTVVGKGEERVPFNAGYDYEREGAWLSNAQKIRIDGTEKNASMNECISCDLWCMYWSVRCCTSQSIAISIRGTWRYKICKKKLTTPLQCTARIIESTELWHSTRTTCPAAASSRIIESTEWRHLNKTLLRVSVTGGDYYYHVWHRLHPLSLYKNKA